MKLWQSLLTMATAITVTGAAVTAAMAAVPSPTTGTLQQYDISGTYVSGISSGGYMANQLHVAYSEVFDGAGIFSAGAYRCAQGDLSTALNACMQTYLTRKTPAQLVTETQNLASAGSVDPVAGLSGDRVYLHHGSSDQTVVRAVNDDLATYYANLGASVSYKKTNSGHAWISPIGPVSCTSTTSPFINNCGFDAEQEMLTHLFGSVNTPASTLSGTLVQFDQNAYAIGGDAEAISMGDEGFAYVPTNCASGQTCKLMVALHGCKQGYKYQSMGDTFMRYAYLNEYADTNNMIVLYPQAIALSTTTTNPNGCWNWWAYGGDTAYAQHGGKQIETIMNMVEALRGTGGVTPTPTPTSTATPTSSPSPTPTATPTATCVTASNYAHVQAGRAYVSFGYAYAKGSNQLLGLWNIYSSSTIKESSPGYWERC